MRLLTNSCFSLTHADQEDKASICEISHPLQVTEEPQAKILKPDLEIPHQAQITSILLLFFPSKLQQLLLDTAKSVSEVRQATEAQSVIYVWLWNNNGREFQLLLSQFSKSLIQSSPNLTRHCSNPDVTEDEKCSQITPVNEAAPQEEPDRKAARTSPLIEKSSNSVSEIFKSLTNTKNKDYKNMLTLSSLSPIGEQLEIPVFKGNALMIYNSQVYFPCGMRHEHLSAQMETAGHHILLRKTMFWIITCYFCP